MSRLDKKKKIIYFFEMELKRLKKISLKMLACVTIVVVFFSPFLLLIDFEIFSPFVVTVWIISVAYFIFAKNR